MGSWNHPSLSKDSFSSCWYTSWLAGWRRNDRKTDQEQAETHSSWGCWEVNTRAKSCQICRVFSPDSERPEECLWWSNSGCIRASRATKEETLHFTLKGGLNRDSLRKWSQPLNFCTPSHQYAFSLVYSLYISIVLTRRTCLTIKSFFRWWSFP